MKKSVINWTMAFVIVLGLIIVCFIGLTYLAPFTNPLFETTVITDQDFQNNQDKITFLNTALPITLPQSTIVTSLHCEGWQDWIYECEGTIPQTDIHVFIESLPAMDQPTPDTYEDWIGSEYIEIHIDPTTGEFKIKLTET